MDQKIGIKYLSLAAILKNKEAINYFKVIELEKNLLNKKKENSKEERSNSFDESSSQKSESTVKNKEKMPEMKSESKNMKVKLLHEDKFFDQEQNEEEISKIIESVHNNFKKIMMMKLLKQLNLRWMIIQILFSLIQL